MTLQELHFTISSKWWLAFITLCFSGFVVWLSFLTFFLISRLKDIPKRSELPELFKKFMEDWARE